MVELEKFIRDIPDFPKEGIIFKDITPLLKSPEAFKAAIDRMAELIRQSPCHAVVGTESRGFIFGAPIAQALGVPFIPIRKPGKLPHKTVSASYELEYGTDSIEIHQDAVEKGQEIALVDDLLATGGTMEASCRLIETLDAKVSSCTFLIELGFLQGRKKLEGRRINTLITY